MSKTSVLRDLAPGESAAKSHFTPAAGRLPHSLGSLSLESSLPAEEEVRRSYDTLHADEAFESPPGFHSFLAKCLDLQKGLQLLDVGCGTGAFLQDVATRGVRVSGIDISPKAIGAARSRLTEGDLRVGSGVELPWADASFDRVSCIGTLEHLPNPYAGAREIARVLRPEGTGLIYVPNTYYWLAILKTIRTGEGHDEGQMIQRHGARSEWEEVLESGGLRIERVRTWRYPIRLWPWRPRILIGSFIERIVPENLLLAFAFVVKPRGDQHQTS